MTHEPVGAPSRGTVSPPPGPHLRLVGAEERIHDHVWQLRDVEYVDGLCIRRLECDGCDGVTFT